MEILSKIFESTERTLFIKKSRREIISIREYVIDFSAINVNIIKAILNERTNISFQISNKGVRMRLIQIGKNEPETSVLLDAHEFLLKKVIKKKITGYELEARVREIIPLHLLSHNDGIGIVVNGNEKKFSLRIFTIDLNEKENGLQLQEIESILALNNVVIVVSIQRKRKANLLSTYAYMTLENEEDDHAEEMHRMEIKELDQNPLSKSILSPPSYKKWRGNFSIGTLLNPIIEVQSNSLAMILSHFVDPLIERQKEDPRSDLLNPEFFYLPPQTKEVSLEIKPDKEQPSQIEMSLNRIPIPNKKETTKEQLIFATVDTSEEAVGDEDVVSRIVKSLKRKGFKIIARLPSPIPIVGAQKRNTWIVFYYLSSLTSESMQGIIKDMRELRKLYPQMRGIVIVKGNEKNSNTPHPLPPFLELKGENEILAS